MSTNYSPESTESSDSEYIPSEYSSDSDEIDLDPSMIHSLSIETLHRQSTTVMPVADHEPRHRQPLTRTDSFVPVSSAVSTTSYHYTPPERKIITMPYESFLTNIDTDTKFIKYDTHTITFPFNYYIDAHTGLNNPLRRTHIKWLVLSDTNTTINNLYCDCKIHITARSNITFNDCEFSSIGIQYAECLVDVFANSKATFNRCIITDRCLSQPFRPTKADGSSYTSVGVVVRDSSHSEFNYCHLYVDCVGIIIMKNGSADVNGCEFECSRMLDTTVNRFHIYALDKGSLNVHNCTFHDFGGKNIFILNDSKAFINNCISNNSSSFLSMAEYCTAFIQNITISNQTNTAIRCNKGCNIYAQHIDIAYCNGNGIQIEYSSGIIRHMNISNTLCPSVFVAGEQSNPIIEYLTISDCQRNAISCRHCCRPVFNHVNIIGTVLQSIKCNFYAMPEIYVLLAKHISRVS